MEYQSAVFETAENFSERLWTAFYQVQYFVGLIYQIEVFRCFSVVERIVEPDVFLIEDRVSAELGVGYVGVSFPFDTGGGYSGHLGNDTRVILSGLDIERTAHFGSGLDSVNVIFLAFTEQVQVEVDQQSVRSDTPPQFRWNTELKFMPVDIAEMKEAFVFVVPEIFWKELFCFSIISSISIDLKGIRWSSFSK